MKKLQGTIFTTDDGRTVFEHVSPDGAVDYYLCKMKISPGKYLVKLNQKQHVISCWKIRPSKRNHAETLRILRQKDSDLAI